ncbi:MAG: lysostaphin resistance A-like protein [Acidimicrobiales bacterium]
MDRVPNFPALTARNAAGYWFGAFLLGNVASLLAVVLVWRPEGDADRFPVWITAVSALALWGVFVAFIVMLSRGIGSGSMRHDFGLAFRWSDLWVGVPVGVVSQFGLVVLVNWPLSKLFPGAFAPDEVERRARELSDSAPGAWFLLLVLVVVVAAPVVEELMYRGLLQQGLANSWGRTPAVLVGGAVFSAVHLQPVEFPGLFAFAVVLGICYARTGRLGLPIVAHMTFNACGITVVSLMR